MGKEIEKTKIRDNFVNKIAQLFIEDYDVKECGSGELMLPAVDEEGNEFYVKIKVTIPRGKRVDGGYQPYNGYEEAEDWEMVKAERAAKVTARVAKEEAKKKEQERKRKARQVVKELNEKGLDAMIHEAEEGAYAPSSFNVSLTKRGWPC